MKEMLRDEFSRGRLLIDQIRNGVVDVDESGGKRLYSGGESSPFVSVAHGRVLNLEDEG